MSAVFRFLTLACAIALTACASIQPPVAAQAQPEASGGYIAGSFTRKDSGGFAFAITNLDTKLEYGLSLGEDSALPKDVEDQIVLIKVPPGRYSVSGWYTYGTLNKAKNGTQPIRNPRLSRPFEVKAKSVVYLGRFVAGTTHSYPTTIWTIQPMPIKQEQARARLAAGYPAFGEIDFACQLCVDP